LDGIEEKDNGPRAGRARLITVGEKAKLVDLARSYPRGTRQIEAFFQTFYQ
jgi:hypothetical protein